jgi:hypothetical protein
MLVYLYYIRTGTPFIRMAQSTFGGDPRTFTMYVWAITDHLYSNFYHKISGDSMRQWAHLIPELEFRRAIHNKLMVGIAHKRQVDGSETDYEVSVPTVYIFRFFRTRMYESTSLNCNCTILLYDQVWVRKQQKVKQRKNQRPWPTRRAVAPPTEGLPWQQVTQGFFTC